MFDTTWIADLDAASACAAVIATQRELRERELQELLLAAHWALLHNGDTVAQTSVGVVLPGTERAKQLGGAGTPPVAEFACAELGLLMGTGHVAANTLMRDALDLEHRHPRLWTALRWGRGRVWKARKVAAMVHAASLDLEGARYVDTQTTPYIESLPWSGFVRLLEAKIIEADPHAANARRLAAEMEQFVSTGQSDEHGLKTLVARATAGNVIIFVAMCDRIAELLRLEGDEALVDVRRARALVVLANPARALAMLTKHARRAEPDDDPDTGGHTSSTSDGATAPTPCPTCGGQEPAPLVNPDRLRPKAVLHVRISEEALQSGTGVAACDNVDVGVITVQQARELLGHCQVSVRPVLDLRDQVPVDAYEVPAAMRQALRMARPTSVFPWSRSGSAGVDIDHTQPYVAPDAGGPPGQTRVDNLGPLVRFGHRVKTHACGWRHHQPSPGVYLWRTPHGYWFRVDRHGRHPLGRDPGQSPSGSSASVLEHRLRELNAA